MAGKSFISKFFDSVSPAMKGMCEASEALSSAAWQKPVNAEKSVDSDLSEAFREVLEAQQLAVVSVMREHMLRVAIPSLN